MRRALDFTRARVVAPLRDRALLADVDRVGRAAAPEDEAEEILTTRRGRGELAHLSAEHDHEDLADQPPPGWAQPEGRR